MDHDDVGPAHDYAYVATQSSVGDRSAKGGDQGEVYDMSLSEVHVALPPELQLGILQDTALDQESCMRAALSAANGTGFRSFVRDAKDGVLLPRARWRRMDLVANTLTARILDEKAVYAPEDGGATGTPGSEGGVAVSVSASRLEVAVDVVRESYELASHLNRLDPETSYLKDDISTSDGTPNLRQRFRPEFSTAMGSQLDVTVSDLRVWLGPDPTVTTEGEGGGTGGGKAGGKGSDEGGGKGGGGGIRAHPLAGELPLLSADVITVMGRPVIAAQLAPLSFRSVNEEVLLHALPPVVHSGSGPGGGGGGGEDSGFGCLSANELNPLPSACRTVVVTRDRMPMKIYADMDVECVGLRIVYGSCLGDRINAAAAAANRLAPPSDDRSPPVPWWDKLRGIVHGS